MWEGMRAAFLGGMLFIMLVAVLIGRALALLAR